MELRQYRLVAQIQGGPQHELTFAVGSQGTSSDASMPSDLKQYLNSNPVATGMVKRSRRIRDMNRRSIIFERDKEKGIAKTEKGKMANAFISGCMNIAPHATITQPPNNLGSFGGAHSLVNVQGTGIACWLGHPISVCNRYPNAQPVLVEACLFSDRGELPLWFPSLPNPAVETSMNHLAIESKVSIEPGEMPAIGQFVRRREHLAMRAFWSTEIGTRYVIK